MRQWDGSRARPMARSFPSSSLSCPRRCSSTRHFGVTMSPFVEYSPVIDGFGMKSRKPVEYLGNVSQCGISECKILIAVGVVAKSLINSDACRRFDYDV